jgi:diacylglycerol O-acyltransferase
MAQRLDRRRPLWEIWVIEGLQPRQWAVISKVHHCMVDGISGTEIYHLLLSTTPDVSVPAPPAPWTPAPLPSQVRLMLDAAVDAAKSPARQVSSAFTAVRHPTTSLRRLRHLTSGVRALAGDAIPAARSSLLGSVGPGRRYTAVTADLSTIRRIARREQVTVNDVVLAAATSGFRRLLLHRGEECGPHTVRSLVPVSVRPHGSESILDNQVSGLLADLPVHVDDVFEQLAAVHAQLDRLKSEHEADVGVTVTELARSEPFPVVSSILRTVLHLPQRQVVTVTTNVPGPRDPLYLLGRRLRHLYPYVPIASHVRFGVAMLSYCDELSFGVTADYDSRDITVLAEAMREAIDALAEPPRASQRPDLATG